jgi:hypothetical protein
MNNKSAKENLEYIQTQEYKALKEMFPLEDSSSSKDKQLSDNDSNEIIDKRKS